MDQTKIGKYDIVRELGRGAMGIVHEGIDPLIGRKVAVKTIRFDVLTAPAEQHEAQQRFMREARSAGNLSHPSIVTIYEVGQHEGLTFIAMEFIEGESLESMLASGQRLPLASIIDLVAQLGDALDYAHRSGVVHRDIKPANVLIDKEGRPRIVDFGIARIASSSLTQTNMVLGTPSYMAPEQIAGHPVDHRADLFALGAILYELLTLQRAFPGENVTTVIYKIMNVTPPPARSVDATLSPGLDVVISKALSKDPDQRYQSGRALADDLRHYDRLTAAPDPSLTATAAMQPVTATVAAPTTAAQAAAQAASMAGTMAIPSLGTAAVPVTGVTPAPPKKATAGPGSRTMLLAVVGAMMVVVAVIAVVLVYMQRTPSYAGRPAAGPEGGAQAAAGAAQPAAPGQPGAAGVPAASGVAAAPGTPAGPGAPAKPGAPAQPAAKPAAKPVSTPPPAAAKPVPAGTAARPPAVVAGARMAAGDKPPATKTPAAEVGSKPAPVPSGRVYDALDVDVKPQVLKQVPPVYPKDAAKLKTDEVVVVKVLIGARGDVEDVQILRSATLGKSLDAAAMYAVRQYTYSAAIKKGQPVACWMNVGVAFSPKK